MPAHIIIRQYYELFNERRFTDAAELFAADAVIEHPPFGQIRRGGEGYIDAANFCVRVFPDIQLQIQHVEQRGDTICEVDLMGVGTHSADLDMGSLGLFKATGVKATVRIRELLEIRAGKITYSSLTYNMHELINQLGRKSDL